MSLFVQEKFNDSMGLEYIAVQAKRSFNKLNQALEKLNEMIVSPLKKNDMKLSEKVMKPIERVCIIDEDLNHNALIKTELTKLFKEDSMMFFTEMDDALDQMKRRKMDETCLIIVDPQTNRRRAWEFLKQHELLRFKSRVILMSNEIDENSIERAKDYKCVGNYLPKPFNSNMAKDVLSGNILIWNKD